jgi:hypothetical protein
MRRDTVETLTSTLVERVQALVKTDEPVHWGHPLLLTTPTSMALNHLAIHQAATEKALLEIAVEVERMAYEIQKLTAQSEAALASA